LQKAGFSKEGIIRKSVFLGGEWRESSLQHSQRRMENIGKEWQKLEMASTEPLRFKRVRFHSYLVRYKGLVASLFLSSREIQSTGFVCFLSNSNTVRNIVKMPISGFSTSRTQRSDPEDRLFSQTCST